MTHIVEAILAGGGADAATEELLITELAARGAKIHVAPGLRPDGVRGIFATKDLDAEEMACWVPNSTLLSIDSIDRKLRTAIERVLDEAGKSQQERDVYARMIGLVVGYLLEKAKGSASCHQYYLDALPSYPPTCNTFSDEERTVFTMMTGSDHFSMYKDLVSWAGASVRQASGLWEGLEPAPSDDDILAAFYFVLSRMSHLRMIPLIDLANAALPREENSRIEVAGQVVDAVEGCAVVTKRPVAKGEELLIDYNHHDAVNMLLSYGCTLGLEHSRTVTKLRMAFPPVLQRLHKAAQDAGSRGIQLTDIELSDTASAADTVSSGVGKDLFVMLQMMPLVNNQGLLPGDLEECQKAAKEGFFEDPRNTKSEKAREWMARQKPIFIEVAKYCTMEQRRWQQEIAPEVEKLSKHTLAGRVARDQLATELRVLGRMARALLEFAVPTDSPEPRGGY